MAKDCGEAERGKRSKHVLCGHYLNNHPKINYKTLLLFDLDPTLIHHDNVKQTEASVVAVSEMELLAVT